MSVDQFQNFRFLRSILKELRSFGLNPNQWRLVREPAFTVGRSFTVHHADDHAFRMRGLWQKKLTGQWIVSDLHVEAI